MKKENIHIDWEVISKGLRDDLLPGEREELEAWLAASSEHRAFYEQVRRGGMTDPEVGLDRGVLVSKKQEMMRKIREMAAREKKRRQLRFVRYAAAVLLPFVFVLIIWKSMESEKANLMVAERVQPGSGRAILELNDGRTYFLDTTRTIETGMDGNLVKAEKKSLVYEKQVSDELVYNKVSVPRAGEYDLTLSDGTRVWLNSDSEIRYPVAFGRDRRVVYLSGEAYFEVEKDTDRPFLVIVNGMEVKVYGTAFNVNTHLAGVVQTTLVHGKVGIRVLSTDVETVLKPNQMAEFNVKDKDVVVKDVDTYYYTAWKSGEFVFENETVEHIMDRLCTWYDMEVFYADRDVKTKRFTGVITRFTDVADVLHLIGETATVHFNIRGNVITVSDSK